jgi:hypothetical protein
MRGKARSWRRFIMCTCKSWRLTKWTIRIQAFVPFLPSALLKVTVALLPPSESTSKIRFRLYLCPTQNQTISSAPFTIITHCAFPWNCTVAFVHVSSRLNMIDWWKDFIWFFIMIGVWCVRAGVRACVRVFLVFFCVGAEMGVRSLPSYDQAGLK